MFNKPFRPPLLKSAPVPKAEINSGPAEKRRRLNPPSEDADRPPSRRPLTSKNNPIPSSQSQPVDSKQYPPGASASTVKSAQDGYFTVLWRNYTNKKHKTWDGDGVLSVISGYAYLQDVSGREMGKHAFKGELAPGSTMSMSGKELEIDTILTRDDFLNGTPFLKTAKRKVQPVSPMPIRTQKPIPVKKEHVPVTVPRPIKLLAKTATPRSSVGVLQFKSPQLTNTVMPKQDSSIPTPRHDPDAPGALVMSRPTYLDKDKQVVDVVVDPMLSKHLRDHQREGIKFLYECVMAMRPFDGEGAILADEMGMGKTLQTIALLWTLLKQNPIHGEGPVIKKALIVCPVTLIENWRKEFRKWLGRERIGVYVMDGTRNRLSDFTMGKSYSIMIIGYEKLRTVQDELTKGAGIDIVIADEGHRLKTAQNKSAQAIKNLNTSRRIILSGTPIQNELSEFHCMVDFVNPGLLNTYSKFKTEFENPILRSRQPGASKKDIGKGEAKSEELSSLTKMFILRRTAEVLSKYLPPKTEYVLMCKPTAVQAEVYRSVLSSPVFGKVLGSPEASLQLINLLKKVCNSPTLINKKTDDSDSMNANVSAIQSGISSTLINKSAASSSAKLKVLNRLLHHLRTTTSEKVVLVSNYTSTLDLLQNHLTSEAWPFLRLDGSTPPSKRQELVDSFNRAPASMCFAFLLSAKAGGAGLNLIGASRLVLFEADWNPSTDLQAMARIHRDGQRREVRIYRLLVAGALDEKIWQRQVTKMGLADSVMDQKASASSFSQEELRDLFTLDVGAKCQTHELLECGCGGRGERLEEAALPEDGEGVSSSREESAAEDGDDDDDDLPEFPMLIKASELDADGRDGRFNRHGKKKTGKEAKMQSLMRYRHVDTVGYGRDEGGSQDDERDMAVERAVDDQILLDLLREEGSRVKFVFVKGSR